MMVPAVAILEVGIQQAFDASIAGLGTTLEGTFKGALGQFLPILVAVSGVWIGIRVYRRFAHTSTR